ncbi:hypothetical protein OIV83_003798 [Microbotryomycetes sp. JL201]|nr:hypothetical protein OIV83_003798 [Microbotryomycetes sp. JL201]
MQSPTGMIAATNLTPATGDYGSSFTAHTNINPLRSRHRQRSAPPIVLAHARRPTSNSSISPTSSPSSCSPLKIGKYGKGKRTSIASSNFSFESVPEDRVTEASSLPALQSVQPESRTSARGSANPLRQSWASEQPNVSTEQTDKRAQQRHNAMQELKVTEAAYLNCLEEIDTLYYQPLIARAEADPARRRRSGAQSPPSSTPESPARQSTPLTPPTSRPASIQWSQPSTDSAILTLAEIDTIFGTFPQILNLSRTLLATIAAGMSTPAATGSTPMSYRPRASRSRKSSQDVSLQHDVYLGGSLVFVLPYLKIYTSFVSRFSEAQLLLSRLNSGTSRSSVRWQAFTMSVQKQATGSSSGGIGLGGLLLNIVQRVPRYRLLLGEILKLTEEDHPDRQDLSSCFEVVDQGEQFERRSGGDAVTDVLCLYTVATHLDRHIRLHAHDLALLELQKVFTNLDTSLIAPGRQLVKTGRLQLVHSSSKPPETVSVLLFTDMMLLTTCVSNAWWEQPGKRTWNPPDFGRLSNHFSVAVISRIKLHDVVIIALDSVKKAKFEFSLEVLQTTSDERFTLLAGSKLERDEWLDRVRSCKSELLRGQMLFTDSTNFGNSVRFKVTQSVGDFSDGSRPLDARLTDRRRRLSLPDMKKGPPESKFKAELGTIPATPANEPDDFLGDSQCIDLEPTNAKENISSTLLFKDKTTNYPSGNSTLARQIVHLVVNGFR